jgi:anthranilate phosphoribosyltransferase
MQCRHCEQRSNMGESVNLQNVLNQLLEHKNLSSEEMLSVMTAIMNGELDDAQIAAILTALRMKGETVEEITACATVMRSIAHPVLINSDKLIDIVGTGGDGQSTFNISTCVSFVVAACGGVVAKHGNRSVSSKSGSADLLETAGININLTANQVAQCIDACGIGFMFAPMHHPLMKNVISVRKSLAVRTVFNLLGPLTNPANAKYSLIGVFSKTWLRPVAEVLAKLGSERVLVVHSDDGLDELSVASPTSIVEYNQGEYSEYRITAKDYGLDHANLNSIKVSDSKQSLDVVLDVLNNKPGAALDIVVLNAAAAVYCLSLAKDFNQAVHLVKSVIAEGKALAKFEQLKHMSNTFQ